MSTVSLYNQDCISVMNKLPENSIDLILTDPPYNLVNFMSKRNANLQNMRDNFIGSADWDAMSDDEWFTMMDDFFNASSKIIKVGGALVTFMSVMNIGATIKLGEKYGFYYKTTGSWHKTNPMPKNMNLHFINSVESWIYFTYKKKTGTFNNGRKAIHDFIETSVTPLKERKFGKHPTQKPEALIKHFVELLSNPDDLVLDPFMGSGTTGVVCAKTNRNFIGLELDPIYFKNARNRINSCSKEVLT